MPTLREIITQDHPWQLAWRVKEKTYSVQSEIAKVDVQGDNVVVSFTRTAQKYLRGAVVWEPLPTAKSKAYPTDDILEMQPCGSWFGPEESYALIPQSSQFWLKPEEWPEQPKRRAR